MMVKIIYSFSALLLFGTAAFSQPGNPPEGTKGGFQGPGGFGPPGFGGQERKILKQYDSNKDGWLNQEERKKAREEMKKAPVGPKRGPMGFRNQDPPKPGPLVKSTDLGNSKEGSLYDSNTLRTYFIEFDSTDWEKELEEFHGTDVDVPCSLTVDGKKYTGVGVHFRGMSSYGMVGTGFKRSLNLSLDTVNSKQKIYGYKTLNLLNCSGDSSLMSSVLYSHLAREFIPAPKANFVRLVINGELWGIYANAQQFNRDFTLENYQSDKGARWKVRGSPNGQGGLEYLGEDPEPYKRRYEIKSPDREASWKALIHFCKTLNQTPPDQLETALKPLVDMDELLAFLALDIALINSDGYWVRASDYSIYLDEKGKFHFLPHDMNEAFHPSGGPGMGFRPFAPPGEILPAFLQNILGFTEVQKKAALALQKEVDTSLEKILTVEQWKQLKEIRERGPMGPGGFPPGGPGGFPGIPPDPNRTTPIPPPGNPPSGPPGGPQPFPGPMGQSGGLTLDPLTGLTDARKPLRSKILAIPALKERYLKKINEIAARLSWEKIGPLVENWRSQIEPVIALETRGLTSLEAFRAATSSQPTSTTGRTIPLKSFIEQRQKYLLEYKEKKP